MKRLIFEFFTVECESVCTDEERVKPFLVMSSKTMPAKEANLIIGLLALDFGLLPSKVSFDGKQDVCVVLYRITVDSCTLA